MADGVLSAFGVLFLQSPSFLAHERLLQRNKGWKNARRVFHVTGILSHTQIRNLLEPLSDEALAADFWDILEELRQPQPLFRFRNELDTYAIALDGVHFFSSEKISCPQCLRRTDRAGVEHFYHRAVRLSWCSLRWHRCCPYRPNLSCHQTGRRSRLVSEMPPKAGWNGIRDTVPRIP
jgi:hypothetical protein